MADIQPLLERIAGDHRYIELTVQSMRIVVFVPVDCPTCSWHPILVADTDQTFEEALEEMKPYLAGRTELALTAIGVWFQVDDPEDFGLPVAVLDVMGGQRDHVLMIYHVEPGRVTAHQIHENGNITHIPIVQPALDLAMQELIV